jgi:hypothetical protein
VVRLTLAEASEVLVEILPAFNQLQPASAARFSNTSTFATAGPGLRTRSNQMRFMACTASANQGAGIFL